ncbi:MAG: hypothetical protein GY896_07985 [Gammaproteobacteria bacterium]|nr:hypothetical protein [Gammaproteobacteria bacterium]
MPENIDRTSKAAWVTIAIALIGLLGTSIATYIQWESNLEIENKRLAAELELEQQRFRSQLILRAIDLESEKDRYTLLEFYDKANLVDGLKPFLDDYAKNGSSFIPRLSNTSSAIAPTSSLQSFLSIAATRDGRRPTADQRVEEAVRLAISGQPEDQARAPAARRGGVSAWLQAGITDQVIRTKRRQPTRC